VLIFYSTILQAITGWENHFCIPRWIKYETWKKCEDTITRATTLLVIVCYHWFVVALSQAMYLVYRALEGEPVPMSLPPPLVPPSKRKKPSVPPVMPLLPSPPSAKDSRASHAGSKTMPHPPKPAPAPVPTPEAAPVSTVPVSSCACRAWKAFVCFFVFLFHSYNKKTFKMISNWLVQCVFQKNKASGNVKVRSELVLCCQWRLCYILLWSRMC